MVAKNIGITLLALFIIIGTVSAVSEWDNAVTFGNVSTSQNPVIAATNVTIKFQLYNSYINWLYNMNLQPTGSYPLLNFTPLNSEPIGRLNPGLNPGYYNYTIAVPSTTPSGTYTLTFTATYYVLTATGAVIATSSLPVTIYVQNKPSIQIVATSPSPSALYTGYNQSIQLQIQNNGYGDARNVTVSILPESGVNILSSVSKFFVANLTKGASVNEPILISAESAGPTGLAANITYYSSSFGKRYSTYQLINLTAASAAQFNVNSSSEASAAPGATDIPITFKVTNTGTTTASQVQLNLQTGYPVTPVQSSAYMAMLPAGATRNVTFLVSVDTAAVPGNYPVTLYEQWKQPNGAVNQQFSGSNNYFVAVNGSSGNNNEILYIIIAVIIIVAIAFFIRRRQSTSKSKK